jgi:hypothetical protein
MVGNLADNPDPLPLVRCAGMDCAQHTPSRIKPHLGQVPENDVEPPSSESWGVFHEHVAGSNLANDPSKLTPKP